MLDLIFGNIMEVSLASSVVIVALMVLSNVLVKRFTAKWRYWLWLIIAVRLLLPFNVTLIPSPIHLPAPEIADQLNASPFAQTLPSLDVGTSNNGATQELSPGTVTAPDRSRALRQLRLADLLLALWIAGIFAYIAWQSISYALFRKRLKAGCSAINQPAVISGYEAICREMGVKRKIPLLRCQLIGSPLVLGIWKQMLVLPDVAFTPQQLRMVLRHELVHIQRKDILYKTLILLVRAVHWFNPLVHLMADKASKDVETSCDAAVVDQQGVDFRKDYSNVILMVIQNSRRSQVMFSTHFGGGKAMLMRRFENLFDMRKKSSGILALILIVLVMGIIGLCISCGQNPAPTTTRAAAGSDAKLLGKWVEDSAADITGLPVDSIEFFQDGKAVIADRDQGTYKVEAGKLQCTFYQITYTGAYKIAGARLTITKDNGDNKSYTKIISAAGGDPKLLGKWVEESAGDITGLPVDSIEFFQDGKAVIAGQHNGTYGVENGILQCTFYRVVYTGPYQIKGTKLTIAKDNGESKVYIKQS